MDSKKPKTAEEECLSSESLLQGIFNSAMDGMAVTRMDGTLVKANPAVGKIHGYHSEEMIGMHASRFVHPDSAETFGEIMAAVAAGKQFAGPARAIRKDGSMRDLEVRGSPLVIEGELHLLCIMQDVTERIRAEQELREAKAFNDTLLNTTPDIIYIYDIVERKNVYSNEGISSVLGYSVEEVQKMGDNLLPELMDPGDFKTYLAEIIPRYLKVKDDEWIEHEYRMKHIDGSWRWLRSKESIFRRQPDGAPRHIFGVVSDITYQKQAEEVLRRDQVELEKLIRERTTQLEASNKELEAFAYSVSHDLRSPLRAMEGFSRALLEEYPDKLDDTAQDYLYRVTSEATRMSQLIDDLLKLSRVTRSEMKPQKVDLSSIAQATIRRFQKSQPERQAEVVIAAGVTTQGDHNLLQQVLENLLGNAWKFTGPREKTEIEFGVDEIEGQTVFFVKDNGVGFDMKYADNLFAPFQRLHAMNEFEGTGIGLSTVQRVIKRHGGRVWIESEENRGTRILFTLHEHEEA